jgi:hypothetical protein
MTVHPCPNPLYPIPHPVVLFFLFLFMLGTLSASPTAGAINSRLLPLTDEEVLSPDAVRRAVTGLLVADGILEAGEQHVYFFVLGTTIETNGRTLRGEAFEKYAALLRTFDLEEIDHWGFYQADGRLAFQGVADGYEHYDCIQHYRSKTNRIPAAEDPSQPGVSISMK